jgi:hypothetical protein
VPSDLSDIELILEQWSLKDSLDKGLAQHEAFAKTN